MKSLILVVSFLILTTSGALARDLQDSTGVDVKRVHALIKDLKKKLEPEKYFLFGESFDKKDISFTYPDKIVTSQPFDIAIRWKGELIATYEVDPRTYTFTGLVTDLR